MIKSGLGVIPIPGLSDIDANPYMKVFLEADESILSKSEKKDLIDNAKNLIENKINPAYVELNKFLKNDYIVNSRNSIGLGMQRIWWRGKKIS